MRSFWAELKKRRVVRAALVYIVVAWVVMQIADVVAPTLLLPDWVESFVTFLLILGFPIAIVLAWAYDLTPEGLKLTRSTAEPEAHGEKEAEAAGSTSRASDNSIAVLPFKNLSSDPEKEYFSDGITEEILSVLARTGSLKVAARTSCFHFKGRDESVQKIGDELGVSTILEGSVRSDGVQARITAQLIDARDGYQVWAETFDRKLDNLLAVQDEIARSIVAALQGRMGIDAPQATLPTSDDDAYQLFLRGRYLWQRRDAQSINEGIELLRQAIARDPDFAAAQATLAAAYHKLPLYDASADNDSCQRLAEAAARDATSRDPQLVEAHAILGSILAGSHRYGEAEPAFRRALELDPGDAVSRHWFAIFQLNTGRIGDALEHIRAAQKLDPLNGAIAGTFGTIAFAQSRFDEALERYRTAEQLGWTDAARAFLGAVYLHLGDRKLAGENFRKGQFAAESLPGSLVDAILVAGVPGADERDAGAWADLGTTLAESAASGAISRGLAFRLAALVGHPQLFELNVDALSGDAIALLWLPGAASLRSDPRFAELTEKFGLPEFWRQSGWPDACEATADGFRCS